MVGLETEQGHVNFRGTDDDEVFLAFVEKNLAPIE